MTALLVPDFEKLPLCYQSVVNNLLTKLGASFDNNEIHKLLLKQFSEKYTMIPELWQVYFGVETNHQNKDDILKLSLKHFVTAFAIRQIPSQLPKTLKPFTWNHLDRLETKLSPMFITRTNPLIVKEEKIVKFLSFPHKHLFYISKLYEEICGPIPEEINRIYSKNVELYKKLKQYFATDEIKYWDTVMEINDFNSCCSNIELLLGTKCYDKSIWEKYFSFLIDKNADKALLDVYRRYAGIFLDDLEIKNKISKLDESIKANELTIANSVEAPESSKSEKLKQLIANFSFQTAIFQPLPFRKPLNNYIYNNASPNVLLKLQKSCKHMLRVLQFRIIHRLEVSDETKNYHRNSLSLPFNDELFPKLNNLILDGSLFLSDLIPAKIIQKIVHCDLKFLRCRFLNLLIEEYEFFVQAGNIELLTLRKVFDEKKQPVPLEILLEKAPKIIYVDISGAQLQPESFQNLLKLEFSSKILYFSLDDVLQLIDVPACVEFLKKNLGPNARIYIEFDDDYPEDNYHQLSAAFSTMVNEWTVKEEKPKISLFWRPLFM